MDMDNKDLEKIEALAAMIVAEVLDEVAPNSSMVSTSQLALGALACLWAAKQLELHAKRS